MPGFIELDSREQPAEIRIRCECAPRVAQGSQDHTHRRIERRNTPKVRTHLRLAYREKEVPYDPPQTSVGLWCRQSQSQSRQPYLVTLLLEAHSAQLSACVPVEHCQFSKLSKRQRRRLLPAEKKRQ
jgi:hypothetical protein